MKDKAALFTVFLVVLIDLMGFGLILPLLPFYASEFDANPVQIGLLYSVYSFAQLIFSPIWGGLSDRIGRRPIMLLSTLGASMAYVVFALSPSYAILFFSRLLAGVMGGNISTAQAYVADVTTHDNRAQGMGLIGAAFGIGFTVGPAVATVLIHPHFLNFFHISEAHRFMVPGFFAAGMSLLSFVLVLTKLKETVRPGAVEKHSMKPSIFTITFWRSMVKKESAGVPYLFLMLLVSMFLISFSHSNLYSSFPLYCKEELGLGAKDVGLFFVVMGLVAIVIQGGMMKMLTKRFGEKVLFLTGCMVMAVGLALIPFAPSKAWLIVVLVVMSIGGSLNTPALQSLISKEAPPDQVGGTMGTAQGMGGLGRAIGPTWGGFLYGFNFHLPFIVTAVLLSSTFWVGMKLVKTEPKAA